MKHLSYCIAMAMLLGACTSSSLLKVDIQNYKGLSNDAQYRMIIENPCELEKSDTVYWLNNQLYQWEISRALQNYLAFIEVSVLDTTYDSYQSLFRTVAAMDGKSVIVKATDSNTIYLSGTESNEHINDFWHGQFEIDGNANLVDTTIVAKNFMRQEIQKHPNDLYGAYLYSLNLFLRIIEMYEKEDGDMLDDIASNSYYDSHNVATPFIEKILYVGDVSGLIVYEYTSYMCH